VTPNASNLQRQILNLSQQITDQNSIIEALEKERDFYFGKLREIEVCAQEEFPEDTKDEFAIKVKNVCICPISKFQNSNGLINS
jgi:RP/EB family microtubule-associated protein